YRQGNNIYALGLGGGAGPRAAESSEAPEVPASGPGGRGAGGQARRLQFTARVEVDHRAERRQVFDEAWRGMQHRFHGPNIHGVNWSEKRGIYEPLLGDVGDQEELQDVVSMMIGELNASHTGIGGGGRGGREGTVQTRFPGFELEADHNGYYKVAHVYKHG